MNLKVNEEKSKVVVFRNVHKLKKMEKFSYNGKPIEIVDKYNYLGLTLSWNGKWTEHIKIAQIKANRGIYIIKKFMYINEWIPASIIKRMFEVLIVPILTYGSQIWGVDHEIGNKLDKIQCKVLKDILGVSVAIPNSAVLLEMGTLPLKSQILKSAIKYYYKTMDSKGKAFQKFCVNGSERVGIKSWWKQHLERELGSIQIKLQTIDEEGETIRTKISKAKKELDDEGRKKIYILLEDKQTLQNFRQLNHYEKGAAYLEYCGRVNRRIIARIRLGNWNWDSQRDENGNKICPLCREGENLDHVFNECNGMTLMRSKFYEITGLRGKSAVEILNIRDKCVSDAICNFWKKYEEGRNRYIK